MACRQFLQDFTLKKQWLFNSHQTSVSLFGKQDWEEESFRIGVLTLVQLITRTDLGMLEVPFTYIESVTCISMLKYLDAIVFESE